MHNEHVTNMPQNKERVFVKLVDGYVNGKNDDLQGFINSKEF